MTSTPINLDQNATTPLDPAVLEVMWPHWLASGNAESRHAAGRLARRAWDDAVGLVAEILGAGRADVVFRETPSHSALPRSRAGPSITARATT